MVSYTVPDHEYLASSGALHPPESHDQPFCAWRNLDSRTHFGRFIERDVKCSIWSCVQGPGSIWLSCVVGFTPRRIQPGSYLPRPHQSSRHFAGADDRYLCCRVNACLCHVMCCGRFSSGHLCLSRRRAVGVSLCDSF